MLRGRNSSAVCDAPHTMEASIPIPWSKLPPDPPGPLTPWVKAPENTDFSSATPNDISPVTFRPASVCAPPEPPPRIRSSPVIPAS